MKAGREHWVPLSKQAIRLIESLPRIAGCLYLFPGSPDRENRLKPLAGTTVLDVIRHMDASKNQWMDPKTGKAVTVHGFRSTFRDWCADAGYARELAEHALAHSLPDPVEAAYHRGTMLERRAPMMQHWANSMENGRTG
jgi:integrase